MQLTGSLGISDLDILVLLDVSALYSQPAGLRVKINSLHTQGESSAHPGAAHTSRSGLCLHLPVATQKQKPQQLAKAHSVTTQSDVSRVQINCIVVV